MFRSGDEWIGTLDGLVNAQIKPQVTGYLLRQTYTDGAFVKKGQLLFEIDPRTFQAALDQAKAQLANAEAQLATRRQTKSKPNSTSIATRRSPKSKRFRSRISTTQFRRMWRPRLRSSGQGADRSGEGPGGIGAAQSRLYQSRLAD